VRARELLADLGSEDASVRHRATLVLGGCKPRDVHWVPDLIGGVRGGPSDVRFYAAVALGGIGRAAGEGAPALVEMLLSDEDMGNRQAAAHALGNVGRAAPGTAIHALGRVLEVDQGEFVCQDAVRALGSLAVFEDGAIPLIIEALEHVDAEVRESAVSALSSLGGRAADALPALQRVAEREGEAEWTRSQASNALRRISSGAQTLRYDEPYHSLGEAAGRGRFTGPEVQRQVLQARDREDFEAAVELLEAGAAGVQDSMFWLDLFTAARELDLPRAHYYYERWAEAEGGFELAPVVRSSCTVQEGIHRLLDFLAGENPDRGWEPFYDLAIDDDLAHLEAWLEEVFSQERPAHDIAGLFFGITDLQRDGTHTLDLSISGEREERPPGDRVIGGSWTPQRDLASSIVLGQICELARSPDGSSPGGAELTLSLAYASLAIRQLSVTRHGLLLGEAPRRVVDVGFNDGDWVAIGTLEPTGLTFAEE
jgi:HEAT repeat protein